MSSECLLNIYFSAQFAPPEDQAESSWFFRLAPREDRALFSGGLCTVSCGQESIALYFRPRIYHSIMANTEEVSTVSIPLVTIASELMAPSLCPISNAFDVPMT